MSNQNRTNIVIALLVGALLAAVACGSGTDLADFEKVNPGARTYSIDDFKSVGFKVVKEYDVEGLTGATSALHGFLRATGLEPQSYELRFYESHDDAVQLGTAFAEEVTGRDAVLVTSKMSWNKAQKEERESSAEGGGQVSFYWDYAIYGNVVMLCEGNWSEQSLEVCGQLEDALEGTLNS